MKEIRKVLPSAHYIYYSDNAHCPYGEKSQEYIRDRARFITRLLLERGADVIVVACNTATGAAIATLREEFDVPFIGMEPAVKPAALGTRSGVIGVLATAGTLKASKYLNTKGLYQDDVRIEEHVGEGFVQLVERGELDGPEAERVVRESPQPLLDAGADTIVLGCTHYPFLLPVIQRIAGPGVRVIDPAPAVAQQVLRVLRDRGLLSEAKSASADRPGPVTLPAAKSERDLRAVGGSGDMPPYRPEDGSVQLLSSGDPTTLHALAATLN